MGATVADFTLAELQEKKKQLQALLFQGVGVVVVGGVRTEYRSVTDIQAALAALQEQIDILSGEPTSRSPRASLRTGYCG